MDRSSVQDSTAATLPAPETSRGKRAGFEGWRIGTRGARHVSMDVDLLLRRAESLPPEEQALLVAYYRHGQSCREIAHLARISPERVWRRLNRLRQRLCSRTFMVAVSGGRRMNGERTLVARELYINGKSMRAAAEALGLSLHEVRRHALAVRLLAEHWT